MTQPDLQSRILALALGRGLVTESQLRAPGAPPSVPDAPWGPKIQGLVDRGHLSAEVAGLLLWEARQGDPEEPPRPQPIAPDSWLGPTLEVAPDIDLSLVETLAWDRYLDVSVIAAGGAGLVFRAFDPKLARRVALKVLKRTSPENAGRLLEEARAQAGVEHPNVCKIYEVGENQGHPFIAMQLVVGHSLALALPELSLRERVCVLREVAEGVHAAHLRGLVHMDLKPGNVLLEFLDNGEVHPYVTDFGLVKKEGMPGLAVGAVEGTPPFASPEQVRGERDLVDRRSDVYSLGVMLYVLLCERLPFAEQTPGGLVRATLEDAPRPLESGTAQVPRDLCWITRKAMSKDPDERYGSALAFAEDLNRYLSGEAVRARPRTLSYRALTWVRQRKAASLALGAGLLLTLIAASAGLRAAWWARRQGELAQHFEQVVDRADAVVRQDAMLPPHDIRKARVHFWEQVSAVRSEMAHGGPALTTGHYALGRAEMLYGDRAKALEHLETAWQSGLRTPVVMAALGEARLNLFFVAREEADRIQDPRLRRATQQDLDMRLRDGGLALLREVNRNLAGPQLVGVESRLAVFEGRWQDALRMAKELQESHPWLYEGWVHQGRAHQTAARQAQEAGRMEEALQALDRAENILVETSWRFPSAVGALRLQSEIWSQRAEIMQVSGNDPFPAIERALDLLDRCLDLDPDHAFDGYYRARILLAEASYLEAAGRERRTVLEALDRLTDSELRRVGFRNGAPLVEIRVKALLSRARIARSPAEEKEDLQQAVAIVGKAILGNPRETAPHAFLVRALRHLSEAEAATHADLAALLRKADGAYDAALAMDPATPARVDMALILARVAEAKESEGAAELERAKACLAGVQPGAEPAVWALAWARLLRAESRWNPGGRGGLLARAKELLESGRPGPDEAPAHRREARALRIP